MFRKYMVLYELKQGFSAISIVDMETKAWYNVSLPEPICSVESGVNSDFDSHVLYFSYSSLLTQNASCEFDMKSKRLHVKQNHSHQHVDYTVSRVQVRNGDVAVPMTLVYKNNVPMYGHTCYFELF